MKPTNPCSNVDNKYNTFWNQVLQRLRLMSWTDFIISTDLSVLWRRHLVWAKKDGDNLVDIVTGRFASTMVFLSLLFSAEVGTYFSPSDITTQIRHALANVLGGNDETTFDVYKGSNEGFQCATGIALLVSMVLTGCAIFSNYAAWGAFRGLSKQNAPIIFRSTVGLYAAQLPSRLTVVAVYSFSVWLGTYTC